VEGLGDNVLIRGRCDDLELYTLLKSSRVFIFPSLFEGWGIAAAEALACGVPVVAYDIPALREIFGKCESVFLVPVGDVDGLTWAVLKVLSLENGKYSKIAVDYARRFEWHKVAMIDLEAIRRVAAESFHQKIADYSFCRQK
jgi:glycosyltransferase involved in cell wall biosynthesis